MKLFVSPTGFRRLVFLCAAGVFAIVSGCGGGGGGGGVAVLPVASSASSSPAATPPAAATGTSNVAVISVDTGPAAALGEVNIPYVTVTVCAPGGGSCQTIDHVTVDTGSVGLRLMASAVNRSAFTPLTNTSGSPYAECAQFASGFTWGSVKLANVVVGGETATSVPIQIIGDTDFAEIPSSCSNTGAAQNTVSSFGSNGLLGIGVFRQDCGSACVTQAIPGTYYVCPSGGACSSTAMALNQQVANPVSAFPMDNNGVLVQLPTIPASGATNVTGSLIFGIGTRSNNALGSAKAYGLSDQGAFVVTLNGQRYTDGFVDSGSNFLYFDTSSLPACPTTGGFSGFYCPPNTTQQSATIQGSNGTTGTADFSVANAVNQLTIVNPNATAFNNVAAKMGFTGGFDFGLPFFYGRNMFTAIEGAATPAGNGPYIAY